ncbi:MAG: Site-specific integrase [Thermoproteota archaeon]|nr:Site-specific integrase [Thermoproteota archaeon]
MYKHGQTIDDYISTRQDQGLSPNSLLNDLKAVKALYSTNNLLLPFPYKYPNRIMNHDRAPTPEELQSLIDLTDLRGKVIISCLALGGFREGTLAQLKYYHVKEDLEKGVVPLHVHVEAEITKGKYCDCDTFLS